MANLGPLEARIMAVVWDRGDVTVRNVADVLESDTQSAYTTVMTVMSRLVDKGMLARKARGRAYLYWARVGRQVYEDQLSRSRVRGLLEKFGDVAVVQFAAELQDVDPERARLLGELLRRRQSK
ncbi:MAG: BlaI/MecI/CopY family transcriptional regulator [Dehalococcoidia bacterium]